MLRSSTMSKTVSASRLLVSSRPIIRSQNFIQCNRRISLLTSTSSIENVIGRRSMSVAATTDGSLITPGTPISTPTLIDIDRRWLDLTAQQQLDIFKALHEREKEPWYTMTTEERKACIFNHRTLITISVLYKFWPSWTSC